MNTTPRYRVSAYWEDQVDTNNDYLVAERCAFTLWFDTRDAALSASGLLIAGECGARAVRTVMVWDCVGNDPTSLRKLTSA